MNVQHEKAWTTTAAHADRDNRVGPIAAAFFRRAEHECASQHVQTVASAAAPRLPPLRASVFSTDEDSPNPTITVQLASVYLSSFTAGFSFDAEDGPTSAEDQGLKRAEVAAKRAHLCELRSCYLGARNCFDTPKLVFLICDIPHEGRVLSPQEVRSANQSTTRGR